MILGILVRLLRKGFVKEDSKLEEQKWIYGIIALIIFILAAAGIWWYATG